MEQSEKLREVVDYYSMGNQRAFCKETGIEPTALNRALKGKQKVNMKFLVKIGDVYPEARAYLEGRATLPQKKTAIEEMEDKDRIIAELRAEVERKNRIIDTLLDKMGR